MSDIILSMAIRNVRVNFLRSILAAIGITIGVIAISSIGILGICMTGSMKDQLSEMGNKLQVTAYSGKGGGGMGSMMGGSSIDNLTKKQYKTINQIAQKYGYVYGVNSISTKVKKGNDDWTSTIYGLSPDVIQHVITNLSSGNYPKSDSSVLIGSTFASDNNMRVGSQFNIGDKSLKVSGIMGARGMSMDLSTDNAVVMTDTKFHSLFGGTDQYTQVNIALYNISESNLAVSALKSQMNARKDKISVMDSSSMTSSISSILDLLTLFATAIGGISLLVAAISIFNIMMMSVTERTREIGVLRSIGTQKIEILRMFIYETSIIGLIGAGVGMIISFLITYVVATGLLSASKYFFTYSSLIQLPYGLLIGMVICIGSGLYPAWKGANMDPIKALQMD
ncbi:FtsX-like permease family protein [uncultured Methanospirillum sp.]|uniref:ABC transporter permease n=1 Tax=uncultured Methanospirillum sp. TaxID=262503 RepID=UPI0029C99DA4|nr:FtsX-like permease family protein [uncultured Methanospirillum sp.]